MTTRFRTVVLNPQNELVAVDATHDLIENAESLRPPCPD